MGRNLICIGHKNQHNDAELQIIYNNIFTLAAFARTRKQVKNAGTPTPTADLPFILCPARHGESLRRPQVPHRSPKIRGAVGDLRAF